MEKELNLDLPPTPKAIDSICFLCSVVNDDVEKVIISIIKRHEQEIRADQDKITRHACADNNGKVVKFLGMTINEYQSRAHSAIMNTKAI